jgi:hypothetical protein
MKDTPEIIESAFSSVPKPSLARDIAPHACPECDALAASLLPFDFRSLPPAVLEANHDSLPLLGPAAFHHYLPAFLLYALRHPESPVLQFVVFHLSPSAKSRAKSPGYFEQRFAVLSPEQRQAIAAFFQDLRNYQLFVGSEDEIARAMQLWSMSGREHD